MVVTKNGGGSNNRSVNQNDISWGKQSCYVSFVYEEIDAGGTVDGHSHIPEYIDSSCSSVFLPQYRTEFCDDPMRK